MGYSIWLEADLGNGMVELASDDWHYTSNCSGMWCEAGADLASFEGRTAQECSVLLADAITLMRSEPAKFIKMNPENGWGSYETLLPCLETLLRSFRVAPKAIVRVCR